MRRMPSGRHGLPSVRRWVRRHLTASHFAGDRSVYAHMTEPPDHLLDDGSYAPGWFVRSPSDLGLDTAVASRRRLHQWFFLHFDSDDLFVGANIVDLALGGNIGVIVLDKTRSDFDVTSDTGLLHRNFVAIDSSARRFEDRRTGSFIEVDEADRRVSFRLTAGETCLAGVAEEVFARPFVQSTAFGDGLGALQTWGNLRLVEATLTSGGVTRALPAGMLGCYDRSVGHRRWMENWNWIAACGEVEGPDGPVPFALHAATDRDLARPKVQADKQVLWVGEHLRKVRDLSFSYAYIDEEALLTSAWTIRSNPRAPAWVDLRFQPAHHRRDAHRVPLLFQVDHSQYFGRLDGTIGMEGQRYEVRGVYATTEDSMMMV